MSDAQEMFNSCINFAKSLREAREEQRHKREEAKKQRRILYYQTHPVKRKTCEVCGGEKTVNGFKSKSSTCLKCWKIIDEKERQEEIRGIWEYEQEHCTCHLGSPPCTYCTREIDEDIEEEIDN